MDVATIFQEQSTVWTRFWSWLTASAAPDASAPVAPDASDAPDAPDASAPDAPDAPDAPAPAPSPQKSETLSSTHLVVPLDTTPLIVEAYTEQQSATETPSEQPNQSASSSKSYQKKKKKH